MKPSSSTESDSLAERRSPTALGPALSSASSRQKTVNFRSNIDVFYFDRMAVFDRCPSDGFTFGLGMMPKHFLAERKPLRQDHEDTRGKIRGILLEGRLELLLTFLRTEINTEASKERLKKLILDHHRVGDESAAQSGCTCQDGVCLPESCECLQARIFCRHPASKSPGRSQLCQCQSHSCGNRDWQRILAQREKRRENEKTLKRLQREQKKALKRLRREHTVKKALNRLHRGNIMKKALRRLLLGL